MIENAYTLDYTVLAHEIDFTKHFKPVNLFALLLTSAGIDSELKGSGIDTMHQAGCTWVLSRVAIEIVKQPYQLDQFTLETWVEGNNKNQGPWSQTILPTTWAPSLFGSQCRQGPRALVLYKIY